MSKAAEGVVLLGLQKAEKKLPGSVLLIPMDFKILEPPFHGPKLLLARNKDECVSVL